MVAEQSFHFFIKTAAHPVVAMKNMNKMTAGPFKASLKISQATHIRPLAEAGHAAFSNRRDERRNIVIRARVIDNLDLHAARPGVLIKNGDQRLGQEA